MKYSDDEYWAFHGYQIGHIVHIYDGIDFGFIQFLTDKAGCPPGCKERHEPECVTPDDCPGCWYRRYEELVAEFTELVKQNTKTVCSEK